MNEEPKDSRISRIAQRYRSVVPSPAAQSLLLGGATFGATNLAWDPIVDTIRSLGRIPGKAISKMSDKEWDEAMDELKSDPTYRFWLPAALGGVAGLASMGFSYAPNKKNYGLLSWDAPVTFDNKAYQNSIASYLQHYPMNKTQSLHKHADDLFEYTGYIPQTDFSNAISARDAQSLFSNDPFLQNQAYTRNLGTSIVANAAIQQHTNKPTLGNIFDSAVDKIDKKLTFAGLANVGVKSVIANTTARMFTDVLGTMTNMAPDTRRNLIDAGTWAGTVMSILN